MPASDVFTLSATNGPLLADIEEARRELGGYYDITLDDCAPSISTPSWLAPASVPLPDGGNAYDDARVGIATGRHRARGRRVSRLSRPFRRSHS